MSKQKKLYRSFFLRNFSENKSNMDNVTTVPEFPHFLQNIAQYCAFIHCLCF